MGEVPAPTTLAELLTRMRSEAGLSMFELAKRTGINRSTLMRIEAGTTTDPDRGTLNALARGLGVEPEQFYDAVWQDADQPLPSPAVYFRTKYQLTPEQIAEIERSIKRVANRGTSNNRSSKEPKGGHHDNTTNT